MLIKWVNKAAKIRDFQKKKKKRREVTYGGR
jgi:hypothetical protein